jgi:hypothetical protein
MPVEYKKPLGEECAVLMSFAEQFGRGFSTTMAGKDKPTNKDADKTDTSDTLGGKLAKKATSLFKRSPKDNSSPLPSASPKDVAADKAAGMQLKKGGKIPKTGNYKLHKGETVVPAGLARGLERLGKKGPQRIKPKKVSLGKKGGFVIRHPGSFRASAKRAGMSTRAYAEKKKSAPGVLGRRARSALGLMAMGK